MHHGWLIINKEVGESSARVVSRVKRLLQSKVGHTGTLDPLACGVLPMAIGEATKLSSFLLDSDKSYEFEVTWGEQRSTDDAEGEVVKRARSLEFSEGDLLKVMEEFKGKISQVPPQFSAIKVGGKRAYALARSAKGEGESVRLNAREVEIYDLKITYHAKRQTQLTVRCSKGTYIRSLARDMGVKLGCYGYVSGLKRTAHGNFLIKDALTLEKLEELCDKGDVSNALLPLEKVLDDIPALSLEQDEEQKIRNGIVLETDVLKNMEIVALKNMEGKLIAIAELQNGKLRSKRVFNHARENNN